MLFFCIRCHYQINSGIGSWELSSKQLAIASPNILITGDFM